MQILIQRTIQDSVCTLGELFIDGQKECFTLEPPYRTDGGKPRAIPSGTYDLTIRWSPHFARLVPHVENVPDFSEILIHWGNTFADTKGCTLVGETEAKDFVGHSVDEFKKLYSKLYAVSTLVSGVEGDSTEVRYVGKITYQDPTETEVPSPTHESLQDQSIQ